MLDDLYKRTSESRGEMMRASRRNFTNSPERGMSRDGEAAAADARSLADNLVRGSSSGARATLGVRAPAAPVAQAKRAPGGPAGKSGTDEDINREDQIWREGVQGAEDRRREYMNDIDERYDSGLFSEEGYRRALEAMERGGNRDQVREDLKERHQAGLLTDAEYMRAAEALENAP